MTTIVDDATTQRVHNAGGVSAASVRYAACRSTKGRREENQDLAVVQTIRLQSEPTWWLAAIADGMGGHDAGAFAAAEVLRAWFAFIIYILDSNIPTLIADAVARGYKFANRRLLAQMAAEPELGQLGTTLVTAIATNDLLYVGNVGDSRCSLWRKNTLIPLTHDDSFVQPLVDSGFLTAAEAENHPRSNELVRALGWPDALDEFEVTQHQLQSGDIVLLCSDGLWKGGSTAMECRLREIQTCQVTQSALDRCADRMVKDALDRGSDDNISVILLQVEAADNGQENDVATKLEQED